jgi:hypothetical protein
MGISLKSIVEEIEKELSEMSTTASAEGYATPHAFAGSNKNWKGGKNGVKSMPKPSDRETNEVDEDDPAKLQEARSRYLNFRDSDQSKTDASKASYVILEIKKMMSEVDYLMDLVTRFKNEKDITASDYWKRSTNDIQIIKKTLKLLLRKANGL